MAAIAGDLTTTQTEVRAALHAGLRESVKIIASGAPLTAEFARQIGADGFAANAGQAADIVTALLTQ